MNHRHFEEWLLNDTRLTPTEKREIDVHVRACAHCAALAETGLALRSARVAAPAAGFVKRFQERLAVQKIAERRRKLWGLFVLTLAGAGLVGWVAAPFIFAVISSPVEWLTAAIGYFLFLATSLQAFGDVVRVLARVVPDFIPLYVWMVLFSALAGLGLLWTMSIWRFTRVPRGVSV
jgi:anti-sigma factor RsiW